MDGCDHARRRLDDPRARTARRGLALDARLHDERLDSRDDDRGRAAHELGRGARVMAVADVYDALLAVRSPVPRRPAIEGMLAGCARTWGQPCAANCAGAVEQVVERDGHIARAATALSTVAAAT